MPGYDGSGPQGRGPMTGGGGGYCVLEIPADHHRPATGFTGLSGRPATLPPGWAAARATPEPAGVASIHSELLEIERGLHDLKVAMSRIGVPRVGAASGTAATPVDGDTS